MHTEIVTLCHSALVQGDQMSMLAAFNTISVKQLPQHFPPFTLAVRARFDSEEPGDHELKVTVADTDGRILAQLKGPFRLPPGSSRLPVTMNLTFAIPGMELRCDGEHVIDLILDGRSPLRTPFYVRKG
jgi:hypothetical protein